MGEQMDSGGRYSREQIRKIILVSIFAFPLLLVVIAVAVQKLSPTPENGTFELSTNSPTDLPPVPGSGDKPEPFYTSEPSGPEEKKPDTENPETRVNVKHILVSYKGAKDAGEKIVLSKGEAYNIALRLRDELIKNPGTFEEVAKKHSHDPATGKLGGLIPGFRLKDVTPEFRTAIRSLKSGGISAVVETEFGYHILKREDVDEGIFQSILIPFKGALHASETVLLSEAAAKAKAERLLSRIKEGKENFGDIARKHSRDPWGENGGFMRGLVKSGSIPHKEIETAAFSLKPGELSEVFRSPLGYHILKRHPIEERQACQIVVLFGGEGRVEEMAKRKVHEAYRFLMEGMPFPEVVKKYSDESFEKTAGGFTPIIYRGTWHPVVEEKLFSMEVGQVAPPLKLDYAWVILARVR